MILRNYPCRVNFKEVEELIFFFFISKDSEDLNSLLIESSKKLETKQKLINKKESLVILESATSDFHNKFEVQSKHLLSKPKMFSLYSSP